MAIIAVWLKFAQQSCCSFLVFIFYQTVEPLFSLCCFHYGCLQFLDGAAFFVLFWCLHVEGPIFYPPVGDETFSLCAAFIAVAYNF
jgi:hypothetical protein